MASLSHKRLVEDSGLSEPEEAPSKQRVRLSVQYDETKLNDKLGDMALAKNAYRIAPFTVSQFSSDVLAVSLFVCADHY